MSIFDFNIKNLSIPDYKLDANDPKNLNNKILGEQDTRKRLLTHARLVGCEKEMMLLFVKADKIMRNCNNIMERQDMGKLFATEAYRLLGGGGELYINGKLVCKD